MLRNDANREKERTDKEIYGLRRGLEIVESKDKRNEFTTMIIIIISLQRWQWVPSFIQATHTANISLRENNRINQHIFDFNCTAIYIEREIYVL